MRHFCIHFFFCCCCFLDTDGGSQSQHILDMQNNMCVFVKMWSDSTKNAQFRIIQVLVYSLYSRSNYSNIAARSIIDKVTYHYQNELVEHGNIYIHNTKGSNERLIE